MATEATNTGHELVSDLAIPPGETVLEGMEHHAMTRNQLADKIGLSTNTLNELIEGNMPMTQDIAEKLENVLSIPAYMLVRLEERYRRTLTALEAHSPTAQ